MVTNANSLTELSATDSSPLRVVHGDGITCPQSIAVSGSHVRMANLWATASPNLTPHPIRHCASSSGS